MASSRRERAQGNFCYRWREREELERNGDRNMYVFFNFEYPWARGISEVLAFKKYLFKGILKFSKSRIHNIKKSRVFSVSTQMCQQCPLPFSENANNHPVQFGGMLTLCGHCAYQGYNGEQDKIVSALMKLFRKPIYTVGTKQDELTDSRDHAHLRQKLLKIKMPLK